MFHEFVLNKLGEHAFSYAGQLFGTVPVDITHLKKNCTFLVLLPTVIRLVCLFTFRSGFTTANQINFDLQLSDLQSFS